MRFYFYSQAVDESGISW
ncbi:MULTISPECIES: hypothetical protein [Escherichia]|uniref:Uncharacterized protein n=1 Tax=Escherichia fergusonii TaxID=564 RepID=A0A7K4HWE5_ESCFE|nr:MULTISPECIES: hypothetical protein [Escherichia]HCF8212369.1 hypothetical protein [Klebsiella pneumoniae]AXM04618.1 hypothetical protein DKG79_17085 [Escherichia fergusonii]EFF0768627.1 hypothetical protein [Escherichia fergusonii]EFL4482099.1 hypothetical protein [Escherichia fergusonii]EFL4508725.1 hypothetical protein [Escherichia fergusonii]